MINRRSFIGVLFSLPFISLISIKAKKSTKRGGYVLYRGYEYSESTYEMLAERGYSKRYLLEKWMHNMIRACNAKKFKPKEIYISSEAAKILDMKDEFLTQGENDFSYYTFEAMPVFVNRSFKQISIMALIG